MKNPTSRQFKVVINNFIKILPQALFKGNLDMAEARVEKNVCGTPMCHGGWYAVAADLPKRKIYRLHFGDGADAIASHLE